MLRSSGWTRTSLPVRKTLAGASTTREMLKHLRGDTSTNPDFCLSHHRRWPAYNTVIRLGASGPPSTSPLRVSLANCFIKPQVQGLLGIHLISGRLSHTVVSALLYHSTMFVLWLGGEGLIFFSLHLHSVYKGTLHCGDPEQLANGFSMGREAYG